MNNEYIIIPGTQQRVYEGSVVMLHRLPNLRWILHYGYYNYSGQRQKGWYFSSIPSDTTMPVFNEDLLAMTVIDGSPSPTPPVPPIPPGPFPPGPFPPIPPGPPVPVPVPFTPKDKADLDAAMLTVNTLEERDMMSNDGLQNGKIVRVNDIDGHGRVEYYSWDSSSSSWQEASLGYRYMTRTEVLQAMGDDIVSIVWSNENGCLVVTNHAGTETEPIKLFGVAHDPVYTQDDLTLRIPIYGKDDFVMTIPRDYYIRSIRFEPSWVFDDGHVGPAIVITVSNGSDQRDIAGDASGMVNVYTGQETATCIVNIDSATWKVSANVKLSSVINNPLQVDNEGLWVDLSGVVNKKQIQTGFLLVADGNGGFTYGGTGVELETTTAIADLTNPEKKVVTANLIADAIAAAISGITIDVDEQIRDLDLRMQSVEEKLAFGEGTDGTILVTSYDNLARSGFRIGGSELDTSSKNTVATEEAMTSALTWRTF